MNLKHIVNDTFSEAADV